MADKKKTVKRLLTESLEKLALSDHITKDSGDLVTKAEALAKLIWDHALGFSKFDVKAKKTIYTRPQTWAINMIYDRLEGKVPITSDEKVSRPNTADKVEALTKSKLNKSAEEAAK